jgi:hypothetical protein
MKMRKNRLAAAKMLKTTAAAIPPGDILLSGFALADVVAAAAEGD